MASVVFFRAANVGGHQKFQPSQLAKALAEFEVVNIGAAGTFVVRASVDAARLRSGMLRHLPFAPEMLICPARDVLDLVDSDPFCEAPSGKDVTRFATVFKRSPRPAPQLPMLFPESAKWQIQFLAFHGTFLLSLRRSGPKNLYPNAVAEKQLGVAATTRNWNTIEIICRVLQP